MRYRLTRRPRHSKVHTPGETGIRAGPSSMGIDKLVFVGSLLVTGFLTGLIWFVQIVHYPLFARVDKAGFGRYHALHSSATTSVVVAPMLAELALSFLLLRFRPAGFPPALAWAGLALTIVVWLATFFVSVPLHRLLTSGGHDPDVIGRLVRTNWIRTIAWSARLAILAYGLFRLLP